MRQVGLQLGYFMLSYRYEKTLNGGYIMNIRILVFSLAFCVSAPLFSMEPTYTLEEAHALARELGVCGKDLDVITHALLQLARKDQDPILISKDIVDETIANIMHENIMHERVAKNATRQVPEPQRHVEPRQPIDPFDEEFERGLADLAVAKASACEYERRGDGEKAATAGQKLSALHTALEIQCVNRSRNKWFITGNLLFKKLKLSAIQTVSADKGLSIPVSMYSKNPLRQLVSHHQIYSSCGFNALANACAIQQQVRDGLPITSEQTRALAEVCFLDTVHESKVFKSLLFEDGIQLADPHHIQEAAADIEKKYEMLFHHYYLSASELPAFRDKTTMQSMINTIKKNSAVHFIINIGGHWVLVSVVYEHPRYVLYYLNSTNDPINDGQLGSVISYIEELILKAEAKK